MAFVIDDTFLPATLTAHPMTDEEFAALCSSHPDLSFEMTAEGELIVMAPTYLITGGQNSEINVQLGAWAKEDGRGVVVDSSTGFVLPNGARRSPDAAWIRKDRIARLDPASRKAFGHLCPDFVVELRSSSDRPRILHEKMQEWMANGAELGWLIDPEARSVTIYRPDAAAEVRTGIVSIAGEGPVAGFVLDLAPVWDPFAD